MYYIPRSVDFNVKIKLVRNYDLGFCLLLSKIPNLLQNPKLDSKTVFKYREKTNQENNFFLT